MSMEFGVSSGASEHLKKYFDPSKGELKDVLIRAGAGAGKTTELVRRVISLALEQKRLRGEWPRLVVTTFTRKATQELRERLLKAGLLIGDKELLRYLQSSQSLHISTIHGTLTLYLKRYGREMGLPPDFRIISGAEAAKLSRRCLRQLLKESPAFAEDFQTLCEETDLRTLEGAVLKRGALGLEEPSLTRVTRAELEKDFKEHQEKTLQQVQGVAQTLRTLELTTGWQSWLSQFEVFLSSDSDLRERAKRFVDNLSGQLRTTKTAGADVVEQARLAKELIEDLAGFQFNSEFFERHEDLSTRFDRIAGAWSEKIRDEKLKSSRLTMEDLELFSLWLNERFPETAARFSKEWDYWLIDEYQDTSPRQVKLIHALTQGQKSFVVGDPQQSIYLFRGARSEVFAQAESHWQTRGGECLELMTNYRTSGPVLEFMNELFVSVSPQLKPMRAGREHDGFASTQIDLWQVPKTNKSEGVQPQAVIHRVQELIKSGVPLESICVLSRQTKDLGQIAKLASSLGIPCQLHTAGAFYERREIQDALSFLKFLVVPEDNENLVALLRSPWLELTDSQILEICHSQERSYWSVLRQKEEPVFKPTVDLLSQALGRTQKEGVSRVWRDLLISRGLFDSAMKLDPSGRREANLWKLVQTLFAQENRPGFKYSDYWDEPQGSDTEEQDGGDASPVIEPKRVQLMTVHGSKGLQFPHVIVPFLNDDRVKVDRGFFCWNEKEKTWSLCLKDPETQKLTASKNAERAYELQKQRSAEEIDRLFYVALTRAQSSLSLIWAVNEKSESQNPWVKSLSGYSSHDEKKPWTFRFRVDDPSPESIPQAARDTSLVRHPWQVKSDLGPRRSLSVTHVLEQDLVLTLSSASKAQNWEHIRSSVRGTEVHRLMESLKYDPTRKLARAEFQKALDFLEAPQGKFLLPLIEMGEVEWGFAIEIENRLLQGQVDLWGRDDFGKAWVVDYKTGSPDRIEKAFEQMQIYAWALRRLGRIAVDEPVHLAAVFPFHSLLQERKASSQAVIEKTLLEKIGNLKG